MSITLLSGDCRDVLPTLAANSVHCVVTSPPYYGLRDYGTAQWDGGDAACDHSHGRRNHEHAGKVEVGEGYERAFRSERYVNQGNAPGMVCRCGARRVDRQIGLEATPDEYLATMVAVFREVRRVLRPDGTLWLNVGDSFSGGNNVGWRPGNPAKNGGNSNRDGVGSVPGLAAKQLLMMPARLALALQADGWWVRSDIIWAKPNPMPESCRDRPTSAHEHVFLLAKSARYFYDSAAFAEPAINAGRIVDYDGTQKNCAAGDETNDMRTRIARPVEVGSTRSLRNVWTIATHAFPSAHFATFPPELAERCIRAGTSERGCCAACGAPWRRTTDTERCATRPGNPIKVDASRNDGGRADRIMATVTTTGWAASCACAANATSLVNTARHGPGKAGCDGPASTQGGRDDLRPGVIPCTVLDPFAGAGTTLLVADRLQRNAIGVELNTAYTEMAMERCRADAPLFADTPEPQPAPGFAQADLFAEAAD